ncbi:competence protein ComL [Chryseobacterium nematophagum]|uniref:Competence protein ComL n=1 Tax=Chryseobacterium nematophagum TaxID=2305228 RepID=A0A3M7L835_9FLAO|nr:DUF6759 domain-containing protein [Chryseobacterium nematophagum]RMZ58165.1 competence protein ComL [Chryseobacterium nematophagum]
MKNFLIFSGLLFIVNSCTMNNYPIRNNYPNYSNSSSANTEREYNELLKTYKPETADVLTDLLNGSSDSPQTSISIENKSRCNMVLTVSGNNFYRKIPIGAGKIGYAMIPKNQNYKLSGMVCQSAYSSSKYITNSYAITLSN